MLIFIRFVTVVVGAQVLRQLTVENENAYLKKRPRKKIVSKNRNFLLKFIFINVNAVCES